MTDNSFLTGVGLIVIAAALVGLVRVHAWLSSTGVLALIGRSPRRLAG